MASGPRILSTGSPGAKRIPKKIADIAKKHIAKAGLDKRVRLHIGRAEEIIPTLPGTFDLVFIDGGKQHYARHFDLVIDRVRSGGFVLADNVLWSGKVLTGPDTWDKDTRLIHQFNQKSNDTLYDQEVVCFSGQDHITETMEGLQFRITAKSFYQTNSAQAYNLYKETREMAGLTGDETVYDLYTGTGTIAQFVAAKAGKVVGVESVPEAIEAARINAKLNSIHNVEFVVGDMKQVMNTAFIEEHGSPDVIITDPPRDGMHKDVVEMLIASGVPRIVYVSCNSATQARDLALMDDHYEVKAVQPVDMFPHTAHVENIVLLEKR